DNRSKKEAADICDPDATCRERPVADVVAADGAEGSRGDLISSLGERFDKWQMPDEVNVVDEMPRTSVGKLDKKLLRKNWDAKPSWPGTRRLGPQRGVRPNWPGGPSVWGHSGQDAVAGPQRLRPQRLE